MMTYLLSDSYLLQTTATKILSQCITFMTNDLDGFIKNPEMYVNPGIKLDNLSTSFLRLAVVFERKKGR